MHALFVDGVVNLVIYLTFEAFISARLSGAWESFSELLANRAFPGRFHVTHLDSIFNADRKDKHRKAQRGKHGMPKRYAAELATIPGPASKPLLSECVAHHLSVVKRRSFDCDVGLVQGRKAPEKSRQLIMDALGLEGDDIPVNVGKYSRFSQLGLCTQGGAVLLNGPDGILAARVKLHAEVSGEAVSVMGAMELSQRIRGIAKAAWKLSESPVQCWETKAILAA
eukprot:3666925-Pyramimonas_sp.AAC.1